MKYYIITYGCQMNKSDSERVACILEKMDYKPTLKIESADLVLVNMCSVRQSAVDRVYGLAPKFQKLKAKKTNLKTVLTGCFLKKDKEKLKEKFDIILDIKDIPALPKIITSSFLVKNKNYLKIQPKYSSKFSANIPIMTGCNNFCTYCVVPYTRGREISRPVQEILCEVKELIKRKYKEIWLLGENVNSYLHNKVNFPKLLKMVNDTPGDFWIRFTSSHPKDLSDKLIEVMAKCEKYGHYLNLPLQSGDDDILKKMGRPYTIKYYKNLVKRIRKRIPDICLSTDVIVGFLGETKKQFKNTCNVFQEIKFDMAYISKYSPRPGTAASKIKDDISPEEKNRREKVLTEILKKTSLEKNKKYVGKTIIVLPEDKKKGFLFGKSKEYKTVKFKGSEKLIGNFVKVKIIDALPWGLKGEIYEK